MSFDSSHPGEGASPYPPSEPPTYPQQGGGYPPSPAGYPQQGAYPHQGGHHASQGSTEVLPGNVTPSAPTGRRNRGRTAGIVAGVVGAGVLAAGGYLAYAAVGGGGERADAHLPGTAVAAAMVDLDPSASQKLAAVRFAQKFPTSKNLDWDVADKDPRKWVYEQITKDEKSAPAWSEVRQWLGQRAGMAVLPPDAGSQEPIAVIAVQVTDLAKAKASLSKLDGADGKPAGVAGEGDWVIVSDTQAHASAAATAAKSDPLSERQAYADDGKAVGDTGIASVWADLAGIEKLQLSPLPTSGLVTGSGATAKGHGMSVLRFDNDALELAGSFRDLGGAVAPKGKGSAVQVKAPAEAVGVLSLGGLGDEVAASWTDILDQVNSAQLTGSKVTTADLEEQTGLKLPGDLKALLGEQLDVIVAGAGAEPAIGVRVDSSAADLDQVLDRATKALSDQGMEQAPTRTPTGYTWQWGPAITGLADNGALVSSPAFRAAVPRADGASAVLYVDIARALEAFGKGMSAEDAANLAPLQAFGMSASWSEDHTASYVLRLTAKG
ncbi:MAG: hypothetical protein U0Q19_04110 [Kineosporiaceae bacterium]